MINKFDTHSNVAAFAMTYPLMRISIASGSTPNCSAKPALASKMVRGLALTVSDEGCGGEVFEIDAQFLQRGVLDGVAPFPPFLGVID
jgi:hypothetical protein